MPKPSTDLALPPGEAIGRRAILVGTSVAVPAIALTVATPAIAASSNSDLTFSQFAAQTANVSSYNGRPVYGPDQTPTVDFTVYNAGDRSSGSTSVQIDFDVNYVAEAYAPNGWTQTNRYVSGDRLVYVFRYNGGGLAGRSSVSNSVVFKVRTDAPWGTNRSVANGTVQSTAADANTSNNSASTDFYVYQTKKYDLSFNYFYLQSDGVPSHNGRPLYGADNGPFLDLRIYNAGPAAAANVSVVVDFAANQVAGMPDPGQGWTKISDYTDKDRRVFRFRYGGIIGPGRDTGIVRLFFAVQNAQTLPPGYTLGTVNGEAEPGSGDSDYGNNRTSATFYTYR